MLKNLKYLIAMGLLAFSYADIAEAGMFSSCTASKGQKGGAAAHECVEDADPETDPNFFAAFTSYHCKKNIAKGDKAYCEIAEQKLEDAGDIISEKKAASNKRKADALSQKTTKAKASAKEKNRKAQAGEDDSVFGGLKRKLSGSKKPAKQQVDEDEDMEEEEEEDMRPAKRGKYSQVDEDEDMEEEEEEDERPLKRSTSSRSLGKAKPSLQRRGSSRF